MVVLSAHGEQLIALLLLVSATASCGGLLLLQLGLMRGFVRAPVLRSDASASPEDTALTVVIPAYNEAANIGSCLQHVLESEPPCADWQVLVVDDASTDATTELATQVLATQVLAERGHAQIRGEVLQAGSRPEGECWVGKNWACAKGMEGVVSEWVVFIDADVRLKPDALRRALAQAIDEGADLFSLAPRLSCACLAEWMVQPIMASLLGLGFPIEDANDPTSSVAFAAGPFMLFRRTAYEAIGGHRALAAEVVEDLALARRIKSQGLRLRYVLGLDAVDLRMYPDLASLWEGWTKNWCLGLDRDVLKALAAAAVVVLMFSVPWMLLVASPALVLGFPTLALWWEWSFALGILAIVQQFLLRLYISKTFGIPTTLWWLMGAGGLLVGAIGPVSVWRTLTGRGWTWKGRQLRPSTPKVI